MENEAPSHDAFQQLCRSYLNAECWPPKGVYRFKSDEEANAFDRPYQERRDAACRALITDHPEFASFVPHLRIQ